MKKNLNWERTTGAFKKKPQTSGSITIGGGKFKTCRHHIEGPLRKERHLEEGRERRTRPEKRVGWWRTWKTARKGYRLSRGLQAEQKAAKKKTRMMTSEIHERKSVSKPHSLVADFLVNANPGAERREIKSRASAKTQRRRKHKKEGSSVRCKVKEADDATGGQDWKEDEGQSSRAQNEKDAQAAKTSARKRWE